jgi:hypothetical protein
MDDRRELHAAEVLVRAIARFVQHVAKHGIGDACLDELDHVLVVDRAGDPVFAERRERHVGDSPPTGRPRHGRHVGALRERRLDEPVRCQHDVELPQFGDRNAGEVLTDRGRAAPLHVPRAGAAEQEFLPLFALQRRPAAAARWIVPLATGDQLARRPRVVIDRFRVARDLEARPVFGGAETLPGRRVEARAGDLNRFDAVGADVLRNGLEDRSAVLRRRHANDQQQQRHESE